MPNKFTDESRTYLVSDGKANASTLYNGSTAGATGLPTSTGSGVTGSNGQAVPIAGFRKAFVMDTVGAGATGTASATITALVGTQPALPTDAGVTGLSNFTLTAAPSGHAYIGEIDLTQVPSADSLWLKSTGISTAHNITVTLFDPKTFPNTPTTPDATFG